VVRVDETTAETGDRTMPDLPLILDCDPGVDDAMAILLALGAPGVEVLGLSTVCGNVPLDRATGNALQVLELAGRTDVGVYEGARRPLLRDPLHAEHFHGQSGLGRALLPGPGAKPRGNGVDFLVDALSARPGEVTVAAIGPLTNLALAEQRRPRILRRARKIVVMGGAVRVPGNVTAAAEFNFYADPEAARQVVHSGAPLVLVGLDATRQVVLERADMDPCQGPLGQFCREAAGTGFEFAESRKGDGRFHLHDPTAVAVALAPHLGRAETLRVDVESEDGLRAGQVVVDERRGRPVLCVLGVDSEGVVELFRRHVLAR
jgi:purine nucleosidase